MDMQKLMEKYIMGKFKTMIIFSGLGTGCFVPLIMGLFLVMGFFVMGSIKFNLNMASGATDFAVIQYEESPIMKSVQDDINADPEYTGFDLKINGPLIMSTLQVTMLYDMSLNIDNLDLYFNDVPGFKLQTAFPKYSLLYEMAQGMIAKEWTIECTEDVGPDEVPDVYTDSWIEQFVGIDGYKAKECISGYSETDRTHAHYISLEVYKRYYLETVYFSKPETLALDPVKDIVKIKADSEEVFDMFDQYVALIYGGDLSALGILYIDSNPIIANGMALPLNRGILPYGSTITSKFGENRGTGPHSGLDLACNIGDKVYAMYDGTFSSVVSNSPENCYPCSSYGNNIRIDSVVNGRNIQTLYAHLSEVKAGVTVGKTVSAGDQIGLCGNSGNSTGPHLHFGMIDLDVTDSTACAAQGGIWNGACYINPTSSLEAVGNNVCDIAGKGEVKSYMDYGMITYPPNKALIASNMKVGENGLLTDWEGYIGVALGNYFGDNWTKYEFKLSTGITLKVVKIEEKSSVDTIGGAGCIDKNNGSVIEFVIDTAKAGSYYGMGANGYVVNGNFNNIPSFKGSITSFTKVN